MSTSGLAQRAGILIVEDEHIVARDLARSLGDAGYDVFAVAASAEEALARTEARRPDLVLMDIRIKGPHDGIETAAMLKARCRTALIYLTAHADEAMVERAKTTQPDGYLLKPVKAAELRTMIDITLHRHAQESVRLVGAQAESRNQALLETARLKDEFIANLSHEIRTPLNGVIGFASLMREGMAGPLSEQHRLFLGNVLASGRSLLQVLSNVLDMAALEAEDLVVHPQIIDLGALIAEVLATLGPELAQRRLRTEVDVDSNCATVTNDRVMLTQILGNLISNAVKFTPEGGLVSARVKEDGPAAFKIVVSDTGIGFPDSDADRLFHAFGQLDQGKNKTYQGAGLGLALTRRIAEFQGGRVDAASSPGGSVFSATLPRILDPKARPR